MRIWIIMALIGCFALICPIISHADRVYVEDRGVMIPIDTDTGDIKTINNANGSQTWIYDHGYQTDVVHPDGTTTSVYD